MRSVNFGENILLDTSGIGHNRKVLKDLLTTNVIDVGLKVNTKINIPTAWGLGEQVPLNDIKVHEGDKLIFENNMIVIGKEVSLVKVSLVSMMTGTTNTIFPEIVHIRNSKKTSISSVYLGLHNANVWGNTSIPAIYVEVQKDDIFELRVGASTANTELSIAGAQYTHFIVEVIE